MGPAFLIVKTVVDSTARGGCGLPIDDKFPVLSLDSALELAVWTLWLRSVKGSLMAAMSTTVPELKAALGAQVPSLAKSIPSSLLYCVSGLRPALQLSLHRKDWRAALSVRSVYHELLWAILKFDLLGTFFFMVLFW